MTEKWTLDPSGHEVRFKHKTFWGLSTVRGVFKTVHGEGLRAEDGTAEGTVSVETASVDTGNAKRDVHLRSADFFDAERVPIMEFTAEQIDPIAADSSEVHVRGTLKVRDTTKALTFAARAERRGDQATVTATIPYDRAEFGMTFNTAGMIAGTGEIGLKLRFSRLG